MKFVTFYTKDTIYEWAFEKYLKPTLEKFKLDYWAKPIGNKGLWRLNTIQKPPVILEAMEKFPNDDIVWIDSDAEILKYPDELFTLGSDIDIGVHYLDWTKHYGRKTDLGKKEMIDGTIFVYNNETMREFIKQWVNNSTAKQINHQKVLEKMLKFRPDIKVFNLSWGLCYIESTPYGIPPAHPLPENEIVILHHQLSRTGKESLTLEE